MNDWRDVLAIVAFAMAVLQFFMTQLTFRMRCILGSILAVLAVLLSSFLGSLRIRLMVAAVFFLFAALAFFWDPLIQIIRGTSQKVFRYFAEKLHIKVLKDIYINHLLSSIFKRDE